MKATRPTKRTNNQSGMVSITVTLVMIIVLTLIVTGFAQVVRRNQREALDRQLSTQAYYAAESGINAVTSNFKPGDAVAGVQSADGSKCNNYTERVLGSGSNVLSADGTGVAYTCVLVGSQSTSISAPVPYGASVSEALLMDRAPGSLLFKWLRNTSSGSSGLCPSDYDSADNWTTSCPYGVLRVDLFDATDTAAHPVSGSLADADKLSGDMVSIFMGPQRSGTGSPTAVVFGDNNHATYKVKANCSGNTCQAEISGLNSSSYYARLSSIYEDLGTVTITPGGPAVHFTGYLNIDSTGRAQDVVKRVQVQVPLNGGASFPNPTGAVASGTDVCKRFLTAPHLPVSIYEVKCTDRGHGIQVIDGSNGLTNIDASDN